MAQTVEVIGYGNVEFPDGMSKEDMAAALAKLPKTPAQQRKSTILEAFTPELPFLKDVPIGSAAIGTVKPIAGAAELMGFRKPAQFVTEVSEALKERGGAPAQAAELVGELVSPIPTKVASVAGRGMSAIPKVGQKLEDLFKTSALARGAGMATTASLLNPLGLPEDKTYGDIFEQKLADAAEAATLGGALGKTSQMIMNPKVSAELARLKQSGLKYLTPGQLMSDFPVVGKAIQKAEGYATSTPLAGPFIEKALMDVYGSFNRSIGNKVLSKMGEKLPKEVQEGPQLIDYINSRIENAYDQITPKLGFKNIIDPAAKTSTVKQFTDQLNSLSAGLPIDSAKILRKEFNDTFLSRLDDKLGMTGEQFRQAEKNLGQKAFAYLRNPEKYEVGLALRELQGRLRKELANQNPSLAKELRGIHDAFISHLPVERAASMVGAEGRVFSPSQLQSAIKAVDKSKNKAQFASGKVPLYQEMEDALQVLGKTLPDSGTTQRTLTALGGLFSLPYLGQVLPPVAGTALLYSRPVRGALTTLATERPEAMRALSPAVESGLSRLGGFAVSEPPRPTEPMQ